MLTLLLGLAEAAEPMLPSWMAGCWQAVSGERWTEECWTGPRAGMMMGSSRSGRGESHAEWEAIQIVRKPATESGPAQMHYMASPGGQGRTAFTWEANNVPGVSFYNRDHDYPQRIRYWREGKEMVAEISLANGSKPRRWRYQPMGR